MLEHPLSRLWTVDAGASLRTGPSSDDRFFGFKYGLSPRMTLGGHYYRIESDPGENRAMLDATWKVPIGRLVLLERGRLEFRSFEDGSDARRFRNRLRLEYPVSQLGGAARAFFSIEGFFDLGGGDRERTQTRYAVGVVREVGPRYRVQVYYLRENNIDRPPADVVGVEMTIRL